jgi:hypothetical protein
VNVDGNFEGPQMTIGTDRPFLVVTAVDDQDPGYMSIEKTWPHLTGWKTELQISGATHMSFCDDATCYQMLNAIDAIDPNKKRFGTIDPLRMMDIQSTCLKAFFDFVLKEEGSDQIFRSAGPTFSEVAVVKGW